MARLHLIGSAHEYGAVHTYRFGAQRPLEFAPGQYGHLFFPKLLRQFTKPVREISFASAPGDDEVWFTLDHSSGSPFQLHFQALEPGRSCTCSASAGTWSCPRTRRGRWC
ncbi:hypothetical protein ACFQY4_21715 [Catellatospora bangladeshensis]|uniref:hypothetical protein n=1 Tax=Catellatospora bangladeshensis TaxID=310355 RepID=UPI00360EE24F